MQRSQRGPEKEDVLVYSLDFDFILYLPHTLSCPYIYPQNSAASLRNAKKRKQMWIISLLFAFTRFVRRIRKELTEPDPSQSKNKEKSIFRKMFARKVENVKRNENPWPSMEDRGGEHRKKLRR